MLFNSTAKLSPWLILVVFKIVNFMNTILLFASLHNMVLKSSPRWLGVRAVMGPGHHCCLSKSSVSERKTIGNQQGQATSFSPACPCWIQQWSICVGQQRYLIWIGTVVWVVIGLRGLLMLPVTMLDCCWQDDIALLLLAVCPIMVSG